MTTPRKPAKRAADLRKADAEQKAFEKAFGALQGGDGSVLALTRTDRQEMRFEAWQRGAAWQRRQRRSP